MYDFLIGEMIYLGYRDGFPMLSALVYIVIHWTRLTVNHDVRLSVVMIHQATLLHGISIFIEY